MDLRLPRKPLITKEKCFEKMLSLIDRCVLDSIFDLNDSNYKKILNEVGCDPDCPKNMKAFKTRFIKNNVSFKIVLTRYFIITKA